MKNDLFVELQKKIKRNFYIKVSISELRALQTYDIERREKGTIYYHVPDYGYVKLLDLCNLKCLDYKSRRGLETYVDSVLHPKEHVQVFIHWRVYK